MARILHVEDDAGVAFTVKTFLRKGGHDVVSVDNARDALQEVKAEQFDLMLVDIHLGGGLEGTDLAVRVKEFVPQLPIVAISGSVDPEINGVSLAAGCVGFIRKPLPSLDTFLDLVNQFLGGRQDELDGEERLHYVARHQSDLVRTLQLRLEELELANEELQQLARAKDDFMRITAHELRTPLTVILGYLEPWIRAEYSPSPDDLRPVYGEGLKLHSLVLKVLDYVRLETHQDDFEFTPVHLNEFLTQEVKKLSVLGDVGLRQNGRQVWVDCDAARISQVVSNLVTNAIAATKGGNQPDAPVIVSYEAGRNGEVIVQVTDQGVGIPADQFDALWKKFAKPNRRDGYLHDGLGLGLVIVKNIVEAHGGRVWVESKVGEGSTFSFVLKRRVDD